MGNPVSSVRGSSIPGLDRKSGSKALKTSRFLSRSMLSEIMIAYDTVAIFAAGFAAEYLYSATSTDVLSASSNYISIMTFVALGFHFIARQRGLYEPSGLTDFSEQLASVIYVWITAFALAFMVLFFLKVSDAFSRAWFLEWAVILPALLASGRGLIIRRFEAMADAGVLRRSVALIGEGRQFHAVKRYLEGDGRHYSLYSAVELREPQQIENDDLKRSIREFARTAHENEIDDIMIALAPAEGWLANLIMQEVQQLPADIHVVPDFGGVSFPKMELGHMGDVVFITAISKPITGWGAFFKMVEDYLFAAAGLFLALPAMALIALAIKLDSKGPVFFRQRRHGYNHQVIEVMKFRTMTVMEDGDRVTQASKNDRRITAVGRILRRTSLDELPQFINVLRGEMSIVGPRPHALAHNSYYGDLVENYANRHRVKPGITGWAQVHGFRGETENPQKMAERVRYDLEYIDCWSIWLDLKILLMTPLFGLFRKGAY